MHVCPIISAKTSSPPPTFTAARSPAIVLAHVEYRPGTLAHALQGWSGVVDYVSKHEFWTKSYAVCEDKEANCVRTVEVYESWEFVDKVHLKSEAIARNQELNGKDRTGVQGAVRVRAVDGFLGREVGGVKL